MWKSKKTCIYLLLHDLMWMCLTFVVMGGVLFVFEQMLGESDENVMTYNLWIFLTVLISMQQCSIEKYSEYQIFCFSRKKFYKEQVILSIIRSCLPALLQTLMLYFGHNVYVKMLMEGTEYTMEMYQRLSFLELFLHSLLAFIIINFILLLNTTRIYNISIIAGELSTVQKIKRKQLCKKRKRLYNIFRTIFGGMIYILIILIYFCFIFYYDFLMRSDFGVRCGMTAIVLVVIMGLFVFGKMRFKPKYV